MSERDETRRPGDALGERRGAVMAEPELRHFHELLLERDRELGADVELLDRDASSAPDTPRPEAAEQARAVEDRRETQQQLERQDQLHEEVRRALDKIETGNYGVCERCGAAIDHDRLEIMPETRACVACERAIEKGAALER